MPCLSDLAIISDIYISLIALCFIKVMKRNFPFPREQVLHHRILCRVYFFNKNTILLLISALTDRLLSFSACVHLSVLRAHFPCSSAQLCPSYSLAFHILVEGVNIIEIFKSRDNVSYSCTYTSVHMFASQ